MAFFKIWTGNIVFHPMWPSFISDKEFMKINILTQFHEDWIKTVPSREFTWVFYNLILWPSFWSDMTQFLSWPRFNWDKYSDSFMKIAIELCSLKCTHGFSKILSGDLAFDPMWPSFISDIEFVEINILTQFQEDWIKTVSSREFTWFILDLTLCPSFWLTWPNMVLAWIRLK